MKHFSQFLVISLCAIGILSTSQQLYAQENFVPGYIVQQNGDTLQGLIDYRNWEKSPDRITFKVSTGAVKQVLTPIGIKGFMVDVAKYSGAVVQTEVTPISTNELTNNPALQFETDTTFLEVLVQGPKELLFYVNKQGNKQFYIGTGGEVILLTYKKYLKDFEGKTIIAENNTYRNQLSFYFNDCADLTSKIGNTPYTQSGLSSLYHAYYACTDQSTRYTKGTDKVVARFGIESGVTLTTIKFSETDEFGYLSHAEFTSSFNPSAGIFLNIKFPRNFGKLSLHNELFYNTYKITGYYEDYTNENKYVQTNTTLGFTYLKLINQLRYSRPVGNINLFFNAGFSNGLCISEINSCVIWSKFYATEWEERQQAVPDARKYEFGLLGGFGIQWKKFSFEFRYERSNGMSDYLGLSSAVQRINGLVGYTF
jgi:hypothetical protein